VTASQPIRRRTRAREISLQFLYMLEVRGSSALEELDAFVDHHTKGGPDPKGREEVAAYARDICHGVYDHRPDIDAWIEAIAENWRLGRMAAIDRNVLRLATYELLHKADVPYKVVINEAIEIAKRFSTAQSGAFVNGILDRTWVLIERGRTASGLSVPPPPVESEVRAVRRKAGADDAAPPLPEAAALQNPAPAPTPTPRPRPRKPLA
jgi:N utilization substance protein B